MQSKTIALVRANWHHDIIEAFAVSCTADLRQHLPRVNVLSYDVPGVVEIPLFTQKLISARDIDIVIVTGLIADHGVYRHDFVASSVMNTLMSLQMESGVPVIYGILTPQDFMSEGREAFFKTHFEKKGREAASAAIKTLENLELLQRISMERVRQAG